MNLDTDKIDDAILDKLDTLFGAFDNKSPANAIKKKVLGKLDRAGGNMLDTTQYTENEAPSKEVWDAAVEFSNLPKCAW